LVCSSHGESPTNLFFKITYLMPSRKPRPKRIDPTFLPRRWLSWIVLELAIAAVALEFPVNEVRLLAAALFLSWFLVSSIYMFATLHEIDRRTWNQRVTWVTCWTWVNLFVLVCLQYPYDDNFRPTWGGAYKIWIWIVVHLGPWA